MCRLTGGSPPLQRPAHSCVSLCMLSRRAAVISAVDQSDTLIIITIIITIITNSSNIIEMYNKLAEEQ